MNENICLVSTWNILKGPIIVIEPCHNSQAGYLGSWPTASFENSTRRGHLPDSTFRSRRGLIWNMIGADRVRPVSRGEPKHAGRMLTWLRAVHFQFTAQWKPLQFNQHDRRIFLCRSQIARIWRTIRSSQKVR